MESNPTPSSSRVTHNPDHLVGVEHAHDLAARGWKVLPYLDHPGGAQITGWPNKATTDHDELERLFRLYPEDTYVGALPGAVGKSVIDFDVHTGKPNGFDTAAELRLPLDALVSFPSASGHGKHNWYDGTGTSKPIYPGIDRKSLGGLVRVPYLLPEVGDVFETVPYQYMINNNPRTHREFEGTGQMWIELHQGKSSSAKVSKVVAEVGDTFTGHANMLRVQTRLVLLAGEGEGGAPEALLTLGELWRSSKHDSGDPAHAWRLALAGAITANGGVAPPAEIEAKPGPFFKKDVGLLTTRLAAAISQDLAIGPDGQIWLYENGVYRLKDDEVERRHVLALGDMFRYSQVKTIRSAVILGQNLPVLSTAPNGDLMNLTNGMLDWRTGEMAKHDPSYLSTVQLPITYDPDALCPNFDRYLAEVVPADSIQQAYEIIGYILMCGNPLDKAVLLLGPGGSGKSTFLNVLTRLLGKYNISNLSLRAITKGSFEMAELYGKTANICGDIDSKFIDDTAPFKQITGRDDITAQRKFGHPFTFKNWAKPVFSANEMFRSNDQTGGYLRRWIIMSFPQEVIGSRGDFSEQALLDEASGILNKALPALRTLMKRGKFEESLSSRMKMDSFKVENDPVLMWLTDDEAITWDVSDTAMSCKRSDVYERYTTWCGMNGHKSKSSGELYKSMRTLNFREYKNSVHYFQGISVSNRPVPALY